MGASLAQRNGLVALINRLGYLSLDEHTAQLRLADGKLLGEGWFLAPGFKSCKSLTLAGYLKGCTACGDEFVNVQQVVDRVVTLGVKYRPLSIMVSTQRVELNRSGVEYTNSIIYNLPRLKARVLKWGNPDVGRYDRFKVI